MFRDGDKDRESKTDRQGGGEKGMLETSEQGPSVDSSRTVTREREDGEEVEGENV